MKKKTVASAFAMLLSVSQPVLALEQLNDLKVYANKGMFWKSKSLKELSFASVYPTPLYAKSYFGLVLTGATVVGAGAFSYFTAGAGAPVAAAGVSSVASWVAGGGAGSYMGGLSIVGGWFGGNAMLGSAILNGISIGVAGGGSAFATLPATGKMLVMASVTSTALDGVAVLQNPETKNLRYRVRLTTPRNLGSSQVRQLTKELEEAESTLIKMDVRADKDAYLALEKKREGLRKKAVEKGKAALNKGGSNEDFMVLAVLSKNAGRSDLFERLLKKVSVKGMADTGYIDYLMAVVNIEKGNSAPAKNLLHRSQRLNPYAVEPALLLINVLGADFAANEEEIKNIVARASHDFDSDKYTPSYSVVSLHYRLATMYLLRKNYSMAEASYRRAYDDLSLLQKHFGDSSIRHTIRLGIANSAYGQGEKSRADKIVDEIIADLKTDEERAHVRSQYAGSS